MTATQPRGQIVTQFPMPLPAARGAASELALAILTGAREPRELAPVVESAIASSPDVISDDDLQLTLFCLYELHYGGIIGADDALEWNAELIAARTLIETALEAALRERVVVPDAPEPQADAVSAALFELTAADTGPSLSRYIARKASFEEVQEFLVHRSIYTLKEADPHSWGIPRLSGRAKAALVEIQSDEYGGGRPHRMHSTIFAKTMSRLGLDTRYGAYVDLVPAITLASLNMMTMFGVHRRLRGAIVGHLAAFEMTSSIPNRFYGDGFRRVGHDRDTTWYFDEHVEADAVHEQIAGRDLAGGLAEAQPHLLSDILFGAAACLAVDGWAGEQMLTSFEAGQSSLRGPLGVAGVTS